MNQQQVFDLIRENRDKVGSDIDLLAEFAEDKRNPDTLQNLRKKLFIATVMM